MLPTFIRIIAIITITAVFILWITSTQRKLIMLDENVNNAMSQIGVQLSSSFDTLMALMDLTKGYAKHESETLIETIKSKRCVITSSSTPYDVLCQERVISEAMSRIVMITKKYPELKASKTYINTMDAMEVYENMVRTSLMIYNQSVVKLNREIRMLPVSITAGTLGFKKRKYLEEQASTCTSKTIKENFHFEEEQTQ